MTGEQKKGQTLLYHYHLQEPPGGRSKKKVRKEEGIYTSSCCITLSQRPMRADVQVVYPFTAGTFHTPYLCTCCSLCFSRHLSSFQFGNRLSFKGKVQGSPLCRKIIHYLPGNPILSPPGCVISRPQCLPLPNGDLTTNLPGLLWRVTENLPTPSSVLSYS